MRYMVKKYTLYGRDFASVLIDRGNEEFTSFPAEVGNPNYDSLLESQSLTDAEVQAMEPDVWQDMV